MLSQEFTTIPFECLVGHKGPLHLSANTRLSTSMIFHIYFAFCLSVVKQQERARASEDITCLKFESRTRTQNIKVPINSRTTRPKTRRNGCGILLVHEK